jgi:hypothetical protein
MREYLNGILEFIGAESLTDEEFSSITLDDQDNPYDVYEVLFDLLESREAVSDMIVRLQSYYTAQGIQVGEASHTPTSDIFVGSPLE